MNAKRKPREPVAPGPCRSCGDDTPTNELATYGKCETCWAIAQTPTDLDDDARRLPTISNGHDGKRGWIVRKPEVMR